MRRMLIKSLILAGILCGSAVVFRASAADEQKVRGSAVAFSLNKEVLIVYKQGQAKAAQEAAVAGGFKVLEDYKRGHFLRCEPPAPAPGARSFAVRVNQVATSEAVRVVEPNFIVSIPRRPLDQAPGAQRAAALLKAEKVRSSATSPDDPRLGELWGMTSINAPVAWEKNHDSPTVVVAVIDTGVDYTHKDIAVNMWTNPGEIAGNNKDDDGNGINDDVFGAKFANNVASGDPKDDNEHGTHCAGTIGAEGNNARGVVGVNWKIQIMALKFLDSTGSGSTNDAIRCIDYAIEQKSKGVNVRVMSNSWGGGGESQALADAITRAEQAGILFVAAAGNESANNDLVPNFPSNYPNENVLAVAAINQSDQLATRFSNFGATTVDIGAPGDGILSTVPGDEYATFSGTSMATPHVAGAAALALAHPDHQSKSASEIKALLMKKVRPLGSLSGKCVAGGTLDIEFLGSASGGPTSPVQFPQGIAFLGELSGQGAAFVLNGSTGEASYTLAGTLFRSNLASKSVETTPDGFEGWVYGEDFPTQPFDFLVTRTTIGNAPYHRIYIRPAEDSSASFAWFLDVSQSSLFSTTTSVSSIRRYDALKEQVEARKRQAKPLTNTSASRSH
jgi:subtilisin family serine protease